MFKTLAIAAIATLSSAATLKATDDIDYDVNVGMDLAAAGTQKVNSLTQCYIDWKHTDIAWKQALKKGEDGAAELEAAYSQLLTYTEDMFAFE